MFLDFGIFFSDFPPKISVLVSYLGHLFLYACQKSCFGVLKTD